MIVGMSAISGTSISLKFVAHLLRPGGTHTNAAFYNVDPANSFEFFPPKDNGVPRPSAFLERSLPSNLFPRLVVFYVPVRNGLTIIGYRVFALPDGRVFMVGGNQSIIYDIEAQTETILPDIPNGVQGTSQAS